MPHSLSLTLSLAPVAPSERPLPGPAHQTLPSHPAKGWTPQPCLETAKRPGSPPDPARHSGGREKEKRAEPSSTEGRCRVWLSLASLDRVSRTRKLGLPAQPLRSVLGAALGKASSNSLMELGAALAAAGGYSNELPSGMAWPSHAPEPPYPGQPRSHTHTRTHCKLPSISCYYHARHTRPPRCQKPCISYLSACFPSPSCSLICFSPSRLPGKA